jgi:hypothetical protein
MPSSGIDRRGNPWRIEPKKFRDKRTGEIVTQFSVLDIAYFEEVLNT